MSKDNNGIKTLGLFWNPNNDNFFYKIEASDQQTPCTKRKILSDLASIFDLLGLTAPITVWFKIFLQHLWKMKLEWDNDIPNDNKSTWEA